MAEVLEVIMILCFGASWPFNVLKSYRARTVKGKSLLFIILIIIGYVAGITAKFINPSYMADINKKWYVLFFYFLNLIMVVIDLIIYFRNKRLDNLRASEG